MFPDVKNHCNCFCLNHTTEYANQGIKMLTSIMQVDNGTLKIINLDRWRTDGEKTDHTVYGCINQLVTASCS